jgi:hypothetical protein
MKPQRNRDGASSTATLGFESQLWAAADALRGSMDAKYKHDVKPFKICYGET